MTISNRADETRRLELSNILTPLLEKYGMKLDSSYDKTSSRPEKRYMPMIVWKHCYHSLEVFIYADNTLGLRGDEATVSVDLKAADPKSMLDLEAWLKAKVEEYDSLQAP